jgi:uncharacterized peroxidase-related enzyme
MNRIAQLDPAQTSGKAQQLFTAVQAKLGIVPNLVRVLGNSPAALESYLGFSDALAGGVLSARIREQISLVVAETNLCGYCLSAHTYLGSKLGLSEAEIAGARRATATPVRDDAVLKLARAIVLQRGEISDADLAAAKGAGLNDAELVEVVANVSLNIFTNYLNHVARTVVDFPEVKPGATEPASGADGSSGAH